MGLCAPGKSLILHKFNNIQHGRMTTLKKSKTTIDSCFNFSPCVSKSVNVSNVQFSPVEVQSCVPLLPLHQPLRSLDELKASPIFEEGLRLIKGAMAKLVLKEDTQPKLLG